MGKNKIITYNRDLKYKDKIGFKINVKIKIGQILGSMVLYFKKLILNSLYNYQKSTFSREAEIFVRGASENLCTQRNKFCPFI